MEALTLREVARKVGVTHAAPYHHFPTRDALLDAIADEAFSLLDAAMHEAVAGEGTASTRLIALGRAYIDFARAHPERLQVMFRRRCADGAPVEPADRKVFAHLFHAVCACQAEGSAPDGDPYALALSAWSVVHGFSKLWVEGPLETMGPYASDYEGLRDTLLADFASSWRARARADKRR